MKQPFRGTIFLLLTLFCALNGHADQQCDPEVRGADLVIFSLEKITKMNSKLKSNAGRIARTSKELREAGYTSEFIDTEFYNWWYGFDFRGKKNSAPTPEQIVATIGRVPVVEKAPSLDELQKQMADADKIMQEEFAENGGQA